MKNRPISQSNFDMLSPNGITEDSEIDRVTWAIGAGLVTFMSLTLLFLNVMFSDLLFKGFFLEFAHSMSNVLIAISIGSGLCCGFDGVMACKKKNKTAKKPGIPKVKEKR